MFFFSYRNVFGPPLRPLLGRQLLLPDPLVDDGQLLPGEGSEDGQVALGVVLIVVVAVTAHSVVVLGGAGVVGGGVAASDCPRACTRQLVRRRRLRHRAAAAAAGQPLGRAGSAGPARFAEAGLGCNSSVVGWDKEKRMKKQCCVPAWLTERSPANENVDI